MNAPALDARIYQNGLRREIYPKVEAALLGVDRKVILASIKRLRAAGKVYVNGRSKPGFWGSVENSYRSNPR